MTWLISCKVGHHPFITFFPLVSSPPLLRTAATNVYVLSMMVELISPSLILLSAMLTWQKEGEANSNFHQQSLPS